MGTPCCHRCSCGSRLGMCPCALFLSCACCCGSRLRSPSFSQYSFAFHRPMHADANSFHARRFCSKGFCHCVSFRSVPLFSTFHTICIHFLSPFTQTPIQISANILQKKHAGAMIQILDAKKIKSASITSIANRLGAFIIGCQVYGC